MSRVVPDERKWRVVSAKRDEGGGEGRRRREGWYLPIWGGGTRHEMDTRR